MEYRALREKRPPVWSFCNNRTHTSNKPLLAETRAIIFCWSDCRAARKKYYMRLSNEKGLYLPRK